MDRVERTRALHVERLLLNEIVAHLRAGLPNEAVGLLAVRDEGTIAHACRFYPGTNIDSSPTRYTMEPAEVLAALRDMAANDWRFGAIIHSHPLTPPTPSATDLREAYFPEVLVVIVGFAAEVPAIRAWSVESGADGSAIGMVEVPFVVGQAVSRQAVTAPDASGRGDDRSGEAT